MLEAGIGRTFKAFGIQYQSAVKNIPGPVQSLADFFGIGHLRNQFGMHKRRHLYAFYAGIRNHSDYFKFFIGRHKRLFSLQAVTQALLLNHNFRGIRTHDDCPCGLTW